MPARMTDNPAKKLTPLQTQRRERILQAVRDQLEAGGYDGVSMRDLAELANVSPTTLYNLFESKDTLILTALTDLLGRLNTRVRQAKLTGLARILLNADVVAQQIVATPHYAEAMARLLFNAAPEDPIVDILLHRTVDDNRLALQEMIADKEISGDVDIELFARRLSTNNWALIFQWMKGYTPLQELRREYRRGVILTLLPAMTAKTSRQYAGEMLADSAVASTS